MTGSEAIKNDFNKIPVGEEKPPQIEEKTEKITNILFGGMIILTISGTVIIIQKLNSHTKELIELNPDYDFPKIQNMNIVLVMVAVLIVLKITIEYLAHPLARIFTSKKYQNPEDEQNFALGKVYLKKNATNVYKLCFYLFMVIFGYSILSNIEYFPTSLGGNGSLEKMFEPGFPNALYHKKPENFDFYYLCGLAFCLTDLIWLIFVYELQSDFILMLLHHCCTISLISFSYLSNWSNIGCIVLFLHDFTDIFVYITRMIVNSDAKSIFKILSGIVLILVFLYMRINVFGQAILSIYYGITWEYRGPEVCLAVFLCFLYIMHVNWVYLIFKKVLKGIFEDKCEDPASVKKFSKAN